MAKETGRPGYDPADPLKLYIYGHLNRVRSSRRLEVETHRNIEVIWLLRHVKPDFKTIAEFRRANRAAFEQMFRDFVVLCRQLNLFGRELLAVDCTCIKAVNNKNKNFTRSSQAKFISEADEKLADYMKRLDQSDAAEDEAGGGSGESDSKMIEKIAAIKGKRERHKALLDDLCRTGEDQISLTDPDARAMARMTKVGVGYNVQIAVDVHHKLIAEQEVCNQVLDLGLLAATTQAAMETLDVKQIDAVADRGDFKIEDIEACEKALQPTSLGQFEVWQYVKVSSPKTSSSTIRAPPFSFVQVEQPRHRAMKANFEKIKGSTIATARLARAVLSNSAAPLTPIAVSFDWRTRPSSTEWLQDWPPGQAFWTGGVTASITPSGSSSNG